MRYVIKLGGSLLEAIQTPLPFLKPVVELTARGHQVLLVHGGGKLVNQYLDKLGIASRFVQGLRATDEPTLEVVLMVLAGLVNKHLVMAIQRHGGSAVGLCGGDAQSVRAEKMVLPSTADGPAEDLGFVGTISGVNPHIFDKLLEDGIIPVVASVAGTGRYTYLNVNADQIASAIAVGIGADRLIYLTDVPGVLDKDGRVMARLRLADIERLIADGVISGGMLPKIKSCREALMKRVPYVCITHPQALDLSGEINGQGPIRGTWLYA